MTNNLGELKPRTALLWIVLACGLAWFVYSRFSFVQKPDTADKSAAFARELQQTKDEAAELRKRVEDLERRQSEPKTPSAPKAKAQPSAGRKGK
jgi:hypothetical protein